MQCRQCAVHQVRSGVPSTERLQGRGGHQSQLVIMCSQVDATLLSTFWAGYIAPEVIQVAMLPSGDVRSTWDQKHQHYGVIPAAVTLLCDSMGIKGMPLYCAACTLKASPSATKLCFNGLFTRVLNCCPLQGHRAIFGRQVRCRRRAHCLPAIPARLTCHGAVGPAGPQSTCLFCKPAAVLPFVLAQAWCCTCCLPAARRSLMQASRACCAPS